MESLFIQLWGMYKSQFKKIDPCDWFWPAAESIKVKADQEWQAFEVNMLKSIAGAVCEKKHCK